MEPAIKIQPVLNISFNDERAFEEVYRQYFVRLLRFSFSIVHQKEAAEEIIQDVFLNLWKRKASLPEIEKLEVFLYVSAKNLSLNYLRDNNAQSVVDLSEQMAEHIQFGSDPESTFVNAETTRQLQAAIQNLPPKCKLIFKLIKEDGLKYKDVALLLNISQKTVEAQLAIAMKKIASAFPG